MEKEKEKVRNEKILRIHFIDSLPIDVDVNSDWEEILNQKDRIIKIECHEWTWNLLTGEIVFH